MVVGRAVTAAMLMRQDTGKSEMEAVTPSHAMSRPVVSHIDELCPWMDWWVCSGCRHGVCHAGEAYSSMRT